VGDLTHSSTVASPIPAGAPVKGVAPQIPTYAPGRIELSGVTRYDAATSLYVVVETARLIEPTTQRSHAAKADLHPLPAKADTKNPKAEWKAAFVDCRPGLYLVRTVNMTRGKPSSATSFVIRVR
jgi:hypothetical protein